MALGSKATSKVEEKMKQLEDGRGDVSHLSSDFWALVKENYEKVVDVLMGARQWVISEFIGAGLRQADIDLVLLAEDHEWLRERIGDLIGSLDKQELERISDALLVAGLERSAVGRRVFYRLTK